MPVIGVRPTLNIERIFLATDFSPASRVAGSYAAALAQRFGAAVDAVHVYDPAQNHTYEDGVLAPLDSLRQEMRRARLKSIERKLLSEGVEARVELAEGHPPSRQILSMIEDHMADLVVMGTSCRAGLERLLLGSTAEGVLRETAHPVLTVGPHCAAAAHGPLTFRSIVYATDFSPQAARAAAFALSFAEDSAAHLYYCYVAEADASEDPARVREFQAELRRLVPEDSRDWCSPHCVVANGTAAEGILALANRVDADLIVLGARKSSFTLTHMERGVTPRVLAEAKCPVLTIS